ncbi:MAG: shikimate kinase [Terrimesophilobacter sp.]
MSASTPLLVLIGPPGAGKSAVGRILANLLHVPFIDTDLRVVNQHGAISHIFEQRGEEGFRVLERVEVQKALGEAAVVSLGGGAILDEQTQEDLAALRVGYISVSAEAVTSRIRGRTRPLLAGGMAAWRTMMDSRRSTYERLATRTVDSSERTAESIAHELSQWIQQEEKA